jgi:nitrate/nitrite transporter NarK
LIISAFFWGYIWTQIPGGKLAQRFGGKRVVAVSIFMTALCNLLVPMGARTSYVYVILLRIGMGLSEVRYTIYIAKCKLKLARGKRFFIAEKYFQRNKHFKPDVIAVDKEFMRNLYCST